MSRRPPRLFSLMAAAAAGHRDLQLAAFSDREVAWAITNGLGPLLCHATAEDGERERCPAWQHILSADLTARAVTGEQIAAMAEILDRCRNLAAITLLKGISIACQLYPQPHLRPMRDLDFLVSLEEYPAIEQALVALGYRRRLPSSVEMPEAHHHGTPFWHPGRGVWIEVHWGIVPPGSELAHEPAFEPGTIAAETVPFSFEGLSAQRLGDGLQLVYLASHWAETVPIPGGMTAPIDLALLLAKGRGIDWAKVLSWLDGPKSATDLYFALTYLQDRGLIQLPAATLDRVRRKQRALGAGILLLLHRLVDRHVVQGVEFRRPWSEAVYKTLLEELLRPRSGILNLLGLVRYCLPARFRHAAASSAAPRG